MGPEHMQEMQEALVMAKALVKKLEVCCAGEQKPEIKSVDDIRKVGQKVADEEGE